MYSLETTLHTDIKDPILDLLPGFGYSSLSTKDLEHSIWAFGLEIAPSEKQDLRCGKVLANVTFIHFMLLRYTLH